MQARPEIALVQPRTRVMMTPTPTPPPSPGLTQALLPVVQQVLLVIPMPPVFLLDACSLGAALALTPRLCRLHPSRQFRLQALHLLRSVRRCAQPSGRQCNATVRTCWAPRLRRTNDRPAPRCQPAPGTQSKLNAGYNQ